MVPANPLVITLAVGQCACKVLNAPYLFITRKQTSGMMITPMITCTMSVMEIAHIPDT